MVLLTGSYTHLLIWIKTTKDLLTIWQSNPSSFALNRGFYTPKKKKIKEPEKLTLFYCLNPDSLALFPDHISFKRLMYLALHLLKLRNHLCLARPPHHYSAVEAQNASATLPQAFSCVLKFLFKAVPFRDLGAKLFKDIHSESQDRKITFVSDCMTGHCQELFPFELPKFILLLLWKLEVGLSPAHKSSPANTPRRNNKIKHDCNTF